MKKVIFIFILFFVTFLVKAQTVSSSCSAPANIKAQYIEDADRLALLKIYRRHLTYEDSIAIPQIDSDTVLNALIAVYNATTLPARDSVVTINNIHTFPNPYLNFVIVYADSTLPWMQQLKVGNIPTGDTKIDSLISVGHLSTSGYYNLGNFFSFHKVIFNSDSNYNTTPLATLFQAIPGVDIAAGDGMNGDGNRISDSIYSDHIELTYSFGWGDCPAGCISRRSWKFNVYFDCSVEFAGSYGAPLQSTGVSNIQSQKTILYPNPFSNQLTVELSNNTNAIIVFYDIFSKQILEQTFTNTTIIDTEQLPDGIYFYKLKTSSQTINYGKVIKH